MSSPPIWTHVCLVCLLATAPYLPGLCGSQFVFDDLPAIVDNADVSDASSPLSDAFKHDFWGDPLSDDRSHKSFRPLAVLGLRALRRIPLQPTLAFRIANLSLHLSNSLLVLSLSSRLLSSRRLGAFSAALFASHPVHVEPVVACVGLADLACSMVVLAATLGYLRANGKATKVIIASSGAAVAVLFKEQGVTVIPSVLLLDLLWGHRFSPRGPKPLLLSGGAFAAKAFCLATAAAAVLYMRLHAMDFQTPRFQEQDNPAAFLESRLLRVLNRSYHYALNGWLLLAPDWLCFDWAMGCVPLITASSGMSLDMVFTVSKVE